MLNKIFITNARFCYMKNKCEDEEGIVNYDKWVIQELFCAVARHGWANMSTGRHQGTREPGVTTLMVHHGSS